MIIGAASVIIGIVFCFAGRNYFKYVVFLVGFVVYG
jgi:hypothetical protein